MYRNSSQSSNNVILYRDRIAYTCFARPILAMNNFICMIFIEKLVSRAFYLQKWFNSNMLIVSKLKVSVFSVFHCSSQLGLLLGASRKV